MRQALKGQEGREDPCSVLLGELERKPGKRAAGKGWQWTRCWRGVGLGIPEVFSTLALFFYTSNKKMVLRVNVTPR